MRVSAGVLGGGEQQQQPKRASLYVDAPEDGTNCPLRTNLALFFSLLPRFVGSSIEESESESVGARVWSAALASGLGAGGLTIGPSLHGPPKGQERIGKQRLVPAGHGVGSACREGARAGRGGGWSAPPIAVSSVAPGEAPGETGSGQRAAARRVL